MCRQARRSRSRFKYEPSTPVYFFPYPALGSLSHPAQAAFACGAVGMKKLAHFTVPSLVALGGTARRQDQDLIGPAAAHACEAMRSCVKANGPATFGKQNPYLPSELGPARTSKTPDPQVIPGGINIANRSHAD